MKDFARLYASLDGTTKTSLKVAAMEDYFCASLPGDAAWALFFLSGGKLRAPFPSRLFWTWATEAAGIPDWMFAECYGAVGDLAQRRRLCYFPTLRSFNARI